MLRLIAPLCVFALWGMGRVAAAQVCDPASVATSECDPSQAAAAAADRDALERVAAAFDSRASAPPVVPLREDELPWCTSAEDPRCAPLKSSSAPAGSDWALRAVAVDTEAPTLAPEFDQGFTACMGLLWHAGVTHRVERPPRA